MFFIRYYDYIQLSLLFSPPPRRAIRWRIGFTRFSLSRSFSFTRGLSFSLDGSPSLERRFSRFLRVL